MQKETRSMVMWFGIGAALLASLAGYAAWDNWNTERNQVLQARANIARAAQQGKLAADHFQANKASIIADALTYADTNPSMGIRRLEAHHANTDPAVATALATLRAADRAQHIAKARQYIAAGSPHLAADELLAYQRDGAPEVDTLMTEAAAASIKKKAADEKAEIAQRRREGVQIGMTAERAMQSSWGRPARVNRTVTGSTVREQWVYPGHHNYLYFENGILTSVQN